MIIKLEDKRIPLAKDLKPKIKTVDLAFGLLMGGLWVAMPIWVIASWLG